MNLEFNFGRLRSTVGSKSRADGLPFRIALVGDFSGRALTGTVGSSDELAKRKPLRVDVDNLDDVIERLGIKIPLPLDGGAEAQTVELEIGSLDDFHPDELYDKLELFEELASLRDRLRNDRTFKSAAAEVRGWADDGEATRRPRRRKRPSRATRMPGGKLSDFGKLVGAPASTSHDAFEVDEWIKDWVTPYVSREADPDQERLIAAVDESLSAAMRSVLQQSEFQSLESIWRGVDLLVRRLETSRSLQIILYDISAEELAADLSGDDDLEATGLHRLLVEQPALDASQGPLAAILGYYAFEETRPHAELLGRMAKIAAAANAPFVASIDKSCLDKKRDDDLPPDVIEAWSSLRGLPESKYLGLTVPQFLLRLPYGKKSDPIDQFAFEEFTPQTGVSGMLWGNGVLLVGLALGQAFSRQGMAKMRIGSVLSFDEMPYHFWTDQDGDQIALPCTDRLLSHKLAETVRGWGYMPVLSLKGQTVVRLGGVNSLAGVELAGCWPESTTVAEPIQPTAASRATSSSKPVDDLRHDSDDDDDPYGASSFGESDDDDSDPFSFSSDEGSDDDSSSDSGDLDSLLSSSGDSDDDSGADDLDLDSLLGSLSSDDDSADSGGEDAPDLDSDDDDSDGMDPELAALLADL
ncbi:MAG: hypothetical protein EA381_14625 [Planctomycetaceae bacterium]|nr:MAG: hypothetical protein EA381_14625 [Planctomycetaceae bacterium]